MTPSVPVFACRVVINMKNRQKKNFGFPLFLIRGSIPLSLSEIMEIHCFDRLRRSSSFSPRPHSMIQANNTSFNLQFKPTFKQRVLQYYTNTSDNRVTQVLKNFVLFLYLSVCPFVCSFLWLLLWHEQVYCFCQLKTLLLYFLWKYAFDHYRCFHIISSVHHSL